MADKTVTKESEKEPFDWTEIQEHVQKHGLTGIKSVVGSNIEKWKDLPINIGITGQSGVGKSSFINAMRGMDADDDGAAEVGLQESTMQITRYTHPKSPTLFFWDLPGAGTEKFPKESYLHLVKFDKYDFFIIVSSTRFTELDSWLAGEIQSRGKQFFFVRTKFDDDVENDQKAHPKSHSPDMLLHQIREYSMENLKEFEDPKIFIISNFDTDGFDFPKLVKELLESLPDLKKRETLALSMAAINSEMIHEKRQVLQGRIWKIVLSSTAGSLLKLASGEVTVDFDVLSKEMTFYKEQFGLDDKTLKSLGEIWEFDIESMKKEFETTSMQINKESITKMMKNGFEFIKAAKGKKAPADKAVVPIEGGGSSKMDKFEKLIPIIGSAVATCASFGTTYRLLGDVLDKMETDALGLIGKIAKARKCV